VRFEAKAAWAIGMLLPVLETYRRGLSHWRVDRGSFRVVTGVRDA
jgi:hypothetical protein